MKKTDRSRRSREIFRKDDLVRTTRRGDQRSRISKSECRYNGLGESDRFSNGCKTVS
ncbi:hypothetical protein LEP1GSC169_2286 [Leptospira santarosai str. HAI1349]|nr:hypothetical protein LEP1GSC169_2286 [Leptospira santarosai str. HAI1349]